MGIASLHPSYTLPDSYGFELEELAQLLAGWHSRAIKD
jgi:hypothetical protein